MNEKGMTNPQTVSRNPVISVQAILSDSLKQHSNSTGSVVANLRLHTSSRKRNQQFADGYRAEKGGVYFAVSSLPGSGRNGHGPRRSVPSHADELSFLGRRLPVHRSSLPVPQRSLPEAQAHTFPRLTTGSALRVKLFTRRAT